MHCKRNTLGYLTIMTHKLNFNWQKNSNTRLARWAWRGRKILYNKIFQTTNKIVILITTLFNTHLFRLSSNAKIFIPQSVTKSVHTKKADYRWFREEGFFQVGINTKITIDQCNYNSST